MIIPSSRTVTWKCIDLKSLQPIRLTVRESSGFVPGRIYAARVLLHPIHLQSNQTSKSTNNISIPVPGDCIDFFHKTFFLFPLSSVTSYILRPKLIFVGGTMHFPSIFLIVSSICQVNALGYGRRGQNNRMIREDLFIEASSNIRLQDTSKATEWIRPIERVELPLDHKNLSAGTFHNRYWVNEEYYKPGGPVFLLDEGEGRVQENDVTKLTSKESFLVALLRQFNGIGIIWEHRYYGDSTPVSINKNTPAAAFKYLDTEQALADVPAFASNFNRSSIAYDLTPKGTPWIFVGGSYPGMRAAFMRQLYPDTIFASWASSAPVEASVDMSFYHEPVWQGLHNHGLGNCAADIHAAITTLDASVDNVEQSSQLKDTLYGPGCKKRTNELMAGDLAAIFNNWQSSGITPILKDFCDWISTDPETNKVSDERGWAAIKGAPFVIDRWSSWKGWDQNCTQPELPEEQDADMISWTWQTCTEWGFFQSANIGPHQIISKFNSPDNWQRDCHQEFPGGRESGLIPDWPRTSETNAKYGGWNIRPSNTFWTAGELDPWRTLSPLSDMSFSPKNIAVQKIPECGKSDSQLFGYLMKDAEHCYDMLEGFTGGDAPRKLFAAALTQWLPCFSPSTNEPTRSTKYLGPRRRSWG
jgi:hypothetical protein